MAQPQHLSKAPVREALIDIQFEPKVPFDLVQSFADSISEQFAKTSPIWEAFFGFSSAEGEATTSTGKNMVGRRLDLENPPRVLQCRTVGLTFSRLGSYGDWTEFRNEASHWWHQFRSAVPPSLVNRIAVRYINELKLPISLKSFDDYLTCAPQVPKALPQAVSGFLSRVVIPDEQSDSVSIVTQALEGQPVGQDASNITVLLDIDVFKNVRIDSADSDAIFGILDALRIQKNKMFFEHITDKTLEMLL